MADLFVDPSLVIAAQSGDALAIDELIDRLAPVVGHVCRRVAPEIADDARQEALVVVFRELSSLPRTRSRRELGRHDRQSDRWPHGATSPTRSRFTIRRTGRPELGARC